VHHIGNRPVQLALLALTLIGAACGGPTSPSGDANFQGVWEGSWQRTSCVETGGAVGNACSLTPSSGVLRLTLTQTGTEVQGTVEVGSALLASSGFVNASGTLLLGGSVHVQGDAPGTLTLPNWSTSRTGNAMTGSFTLMFVADNPALGSQTVQLTLQSVTKTS
jgi:hypothetical protein